jgi:hypothetical protein
MGEMNDPENLPQSPGSSFWRVAGAGGWPGRKMENELGAPRVGFTRGGFGLVVRFLSRRVSQPLI